jgi:hypothetical protein
MRPFIKRQVLMGQKRLLSISMTVDTTKTGSATNTFVLPIILDASETAKIYWGDGSSDVGVTGNNTHVYSTTGTYTVKIESKGFGGFYFNNGGDRAKVISISEFSNVPSRLNTSTFFGCSNLTSVTSLSSPVLIGSASAMHRNNSALTAAPAYNTVAVTSMANMYQSCSALTTIPLYDMTNVTTATSMLLGATLTTQSYSDFLVNLATQSLKSGVTFSGGSSKYNTVGATARAYLIATFGWTITDGGAAP